MIGKFIQPLINLLSKDFNNIIISYKPSALFLKKNSTIFIIILFINLSIVFIFSNVLKFIIILFKILIKFKNVPSFVFLLKIKMLQSSKKKFIKYVLNIRKSS